MRTEVIKRTSELLSDEIAKDVGECALDKADTDIVDVCVQETMDVLETKVSELLLENINSRHNEFAIERWWEDAK